MAKGLLRRAGGLKGRGILGLVSCQLPRMMTTMGPFRSKVCNAATVLTHKNRKQKKKQQNVAASVGRESV